MKHHTLSVNNVVAQKTNKQTKTLKRISYFFHSFTILNLVFVKYHQNQVKLAKAKSVNTEACVPSSSELSKKPYWNWQPCLWQD